MDIDIDKHNQVKVLRGKWKGRKGYVSHRASEAKGSSKKRYALRIQTGMGFKTLLMNRDGFELISN